MAQKGRRGSRNRPIEAKEINGLADIGRAFDNIAGGLSEVAQKTYEVPDDRDGPDPRLITLRLEQLMEAIAEYRNEFTHWERIIAEYAIHRHGYSQRKTAIFLNVAFTTMNRWSQHPVSDIPALLRNRKKNYRQQGRYPR